MDNFNEAVFRAKVDSALATVRTILDTTKYPQRPLEGTHEYEDKYLTVERAARNSATALLVVLDVLGFNEDAMDQALAWTLAKKAVSISLTAFEKTTFIKKTTRDVESATKHVVEKESKLLGKSKTTHKTITTITEYHWKWEYGYKLIVFGGGSRSEAVELQGRDNGETEIITSSDKSPHPAKRDVPALDLNLSWIFDRLVAPEKEGTPTAEELVVSFNVDRNKKTCHTPRRNEDIEKALSFYRSVYSWANSVDAYFRTVFSKESLAKLDMSSINDNSVFNPVLPLYLPNNTGEGPSQSLLPGKDLHAFFREQRRSLNAKLQMLGRTFPDSNRLTTVAEANLLAALKHAVSIALRFSDVINFVEWKIEQQLIAAVGKSLTPKDFGEYMEFHCRKLFLEQYAPKPFVYAVRRPDMCPEGILTIEADIGDGSLEQPVNTLVASRNSTLADPMYFALGAATRAAFVGEQHVHGLILHQFSGDSGVKLRLVARARQFSSFILMLGTMVSGNTFKPTHGIIIQNKDELFLSLLLETIPSAKQFRDAIESLSPEQQRFAKAFRAMQLESTLFAMCVVQIKPQMEKLLNLPNESLIKEIKLTQDLMELFITYQIPSDLLSFDGDATLSPADKIASVKKHVKDIYDVIEESKQKELKEVKEEAQFNIMDSIAASGRAPPRPQPVSAPARSPAPRMMMRGAGAAAPNMMMMRGGGGPGGPPPPPQAMMSMSAAAPPPMARQMAVPSAPTPVAAKLARPTTTTTTSTKPAAKPADNNAPEASKEQSLDAGGDSDVAGVDVTKLPSAIDGALDKVVEGAVRPTTIKPATTWRKLFQKKLLAKPSEVSLSKDGLKSEKNRAFDLLDALTKSGALPLHNTVLHVVIANTVSFDKSLLHTVTRDNINPIEKAEAVAVTISSALTGTKPQKLVKESQYERLVTYTPQLAIEAKKDNDDDDDNDK